MKINKLLNCSQIWCISTKIICDFRKNNGETPVCFRKKGKTDGSPSVFLAVPRLLLFARAAKTPGGKLRSAFLFVFFLIAGDHRKEFLQRVDEHGKILYELIDVINR